jgi:hypothetical protein
MNIVLLIVFVILSALAAWIIIMNWWIVVSYPFTKRHVSWVPLVGGILGCAATLAYPTGKTARYWWIPLVLDWGTFPGLFYSLVYYLTVGRKSSRKE